MYGNDLETGIPPNDEPSAPTLRDVSTALITQAAVPAQ